MVILYERLNEQQHYVEHENALSSLAVSQGSLIASGEKGENPRIHLWDVHTLKTIHVFQNDHKADVYLLEFIKNDKYLASCSLRTNTPVVVYDVNTRTVVFSYWVDELVRQVVPIFTDIQKFGESRDPTHMYTEKNFILLSKYKAYYIKQNPTSSVEIKRVLADGDFGILHVHLRLHPDDRGRAAVEIFRLEGGKIAEHWDVIQSIPETAANTAIRCSERVTRSWASRRLERTRTPRIERPEWIFRSIRRAKWPA